MAYINDTIKRVVLDISHDKYLLPAIQREIVWEAEQIESLFDSILSGYPINSMLFWKYNLSNNDNDYKFYKFIKCYDQYNKTNNHNKEHDTKGEKEILAVLDGQQRLTALFIGLKGYMNLRKRYYRDGKSNSYDKKYLFLNLLYNKEDSQDNDVASDYQFKFKTKEDVIKENSDRSHLWFEVGEVLNYEKISEYKKTLPEWIKELDENIVDDIDDILSKLKRYFTESDTFLNYFMEETESLDRALKIFVRINSGGTQLDYTDFLMSMIISKWRDAKDKVNESLSAIEKDYDFTIPKDIFLRGCLYLTNSPLVFKADNFKSGTIITIKDNFDEIVTYLRASCYTFKLLGYSKDNLRSNLILLPVAQFLYQNKIKEPNAENLNIISNWIQRSIIGMVFGSQTTTYLSRLREDIQGEKTFPLEKIMQTSALMRRSMEIDEKILPDIIAKARHGSQLSWALLTILYPNNDYRGEVFHEDHIYPKSKLAKKMMDSGGDYLANLQLLKGKLNQNKQAEMPDEWIKAFCNDDAEKIKKYKEENFMPTDIELSIENFDKYIEKRKELILETLINKLKIV